VLAAENAFGLTGKHCALLKAPKIQDLLHLLVEGVYPTQKIINGCIVRVLRIRLSGIGNGYWLIRKLKALTIKIMTQKNIEIARSYSEKIKIGDYLTADFFMSAKAEVGEKEIEQRSQELYQLCVREVKKSIEEYLKPKPVDAKPDWDEKKQELYNENSELETINIEQQIK